MEIAADGGSTVECGLRSIPACRSTLDLTEVPVGVWGGGEVSTVDKKLLK